MLCLFVLLCGTHPQLAIKTDPTTQTDSKPYSLTNNPINESFFIKKGKIASNVQEGHIMFEFNLTSLYKGVEKVRAISRNIMHHAKNPVYHTIKAQMQTGNQTANALLVKMEDRQEELYNIFSRQYEMESRNKRFIGLVAGFLAGTIGMYTIQQLFGMRDTFRLAENQRKVFTIIQDHEARVTKMEDQIKTINQTIAKVIMGLDQELSDIKMEEYISELVSIAELEFFHHDEISAAILDLVNGQINPTLLSTSTIYNALKDLRKQAKERGLVIPLQRLEEIYLLPNDFIYEKDTITIFIHIPLVEIKPMTLYQLEPLFLNITKKHSGIIDELNYIAVNDDESSYKILTPEELGKCVKLHPHHYYCYHNILLRDFSNYCISAIYKANMDVANHICDVKVIPQEHWAKQMSKNLFITYSRHNTHLKIRCKGEG